MIPADLPRLREISRVVFGQEHLLPVAVALEEADQPLTMSELVASAGVSHASSIARAVKRLVDGGFVERLPATGGDLARPYQKLESRFWGLIVELYERVPGHQPLF